MNKSACVKLKEFLVSDNLPQKMKRKNIHIATIDELWHGLRDLVEDDQTTTISSDAIDIYKECGFAVSPDGIGWIVQ